MNIAKLRLFRAAVKEPDNPIKGMMRGKLGCLLILAVVLTISGDAYSSALQEPPPPDRPNIVMILTDDMQADDLEYMPETRRLIADQGATFQNAFVTLPLCCPSRASILRGQYAHNHLVKDGSPAPPEGGFQRFHDLGHEHSTVATWLQDSGYRTALIGKYLNGYPDEQPQTYVPPGWDEWYALASGQREYYEYDLNENGAVVHYGSAEEDYMTDVFAGKARDYIRRTAADATPFFMYLAPTAPHGPSTAAPRHEGLFPGVRVPRTPSFNERNVSDKPAWIRENLPRLSSERKGIIDVSYRKRLGALQAVDEMVAGLVSELEFAGELDNTYIFFTSDNGKQLGEHRILEKKVPYEESLRVPLVARGPGISAGRTTGQMALNTDFAPTFADLAGTSAPEFVDGRSLRPLLAADAPSWRTGFMIEHWESSSDGEPIPSYEGVRTDRHKYVEYPASNEQELYDLVADPYEIKSAHQTRLDLANDLKRRLDVLRTCAGQTCRDAEDGP